MDGFTADYLANLTADLTGKVLEAAGRKLRVALSGTEEQQALHRCVEAGLVALIAEATVESPESISLLQDISTEFFEDPLTVLEISKLLRGRSPDRDELADLFKQAGYDTATLPGLRFAAGIAAFEAAFVEAAIAETVLQELVQTGHLVEQTRLQRALLLEVQKLLSILRQARPGSVGIQAGQISAENVVNGVQVVYQWGGGGTSLLDEDDTHRYLAHLAAEANLLPWASLDPDYADPSRGESLGLADVYIALDTAELERVESEGELRAFLAHQAEARRIPAQEMINQEPRLLLLGDPGSGKSTLVNFVAYVLAQAGQAGEPSPWLERLEPWDHGPMLPLRVVLREFAARLPEGTRRGRATFLIQHLRAILDEWGQSTFWSYLQRALGDKERPLLFLLDGLDEVPVDLRRVVVESVDAFASCYRQHRYLVTCRPYAYVGQPWRLSGFREVTLAPFSEDQIADFITFWYDELARRGRFTAPQATTRAERLQAAAARVDLRGLAERPLLLTVMALLHTFRGQLPDDRVELYRWTVDLLLRRWEGRVGDEQGILETLALPDLKMSDLEAGLYEVAFRAHQGQGESGGTADVDEADLRKWLAPYLGGSWDRAGRFADYIRERAGLLVRHKPAAYTFPHRTFQEYLAACHLTGHPDFPAEAARLVRGDLDRWRVVYVLAAGQAARTHRLGSALSAVNALCPESCVPGKGVDDDAWRSAVLAGEALLEIGLVGVRREPMGQAVLKRTQGWLAALLQAGPLDPRERVEAGNVLAQLGDSRLGAGVNPDTDLPDIVWIEIPAGSFLMGTRPEDVPLLEERFGKYEWYSYEWETPRHEVTLPAYYIARYPITNTQFRAFVEAGGYRERQYWEEAEALGLWQDGKVRRAYPYYDEEGEVKWTEEWGDAPANYDEPFNLPNHPVVGVSWYEAVAFCCWLEEQLQIADYRLQVWRGGQLETLDLEPETLTLRLPSEAEWEKAARGMDGRTFPWGDEGDRNRANYDETGIGTTSTVGCFPGGASPYEVEDLSGNVWEWTRSLWGKSWEQPDFGYPYDPGDGREDLKAERGVYRVVRGGSFLDLQWSVRCAYRLRYYPDFRLDLMGFRVMVASPVHL